MEKTEPERLCLAFGMTVRQFREQYRKGKTGPMTQEELGRSVGLDRSYITALESGRHNPTLTTVWKLLPVLGVTGAKFMRALTRNYQETQNRP